MPLLATQYRYPRFRAEHLKDALSFRGGPQAGQPFPDFELETTEGSRVKKSDFLGKPLLIVTGSATCPMTASASRVLKKLHAELGQRVNFLTIYVREAHPGELIGQAKSYDEKKENAAYFSRRDGIVWPVAVDGLEGELHQLIGNHPNAAYILDENGDVVYRLLWSNDEASLRRGIGAALGETDEAYGEEQPRFVPLLSGIGALSQTLQQAGPSAEQDFKREAKPVYAAGKLAGAFKPLPPLGRGLAALAVTVAGLGAIVYGVSKLASSSKRED